MRLPIGVIILPIILSLSSSCHAWYTLFTSAMDLLDYGQRLIGFLPNKTQEEGPSEIKDEFDRFGVRFDAGISSIREDLDDLKSYLSEGLKDLASKNSLAETQRFLQLATENIRDKFIDCALIQEHLIKGDADITIENFKYLGDVINDVDNLWSGIKNTFIGGDVLSLIQKDFITSKLMFENVCTAKVSQLQLIERLFIHFKSTSSEVFLIKHIIYNYFETYHSVKDDYDSIQVHDTRRNEWNNKFYGTYDRIMKSFENQIQTMSPKVWRCDPFRFGKSNYLELKAFTKYYARSFDFGSSFHACGYDCLEKNPHGPQKVLDDCMSSNCYKLNTRLRPDKAGHQSEIREYTRNCSKPLAACKLKPDGTGLLYVCAEKDKTKYHRYTSLQADDHCIYSRKAFNLTANNDEPTYPLECTCPEETYYISTQHTQADNDQVIVGAQIQVSEDKILYIKVKQGIPTAGGIINSTEWLDAPVNKSASHQISWGDCDEFDLSEIKLPDDRVIVGLGFTGCVNGRIHLRVLTKTFDLTTGTVGDDLREEDLIRGTKLYSVNNTDVPTRGKDQNRPIDLKDGDYVKLALSNLEKDVGQTTVPFIDIQEVAPAVPVALSGASLVLRTQPGYGGFLGIQVFTYNVYPYLPPRKARSQVDVDALLWGQLGSHELSD